MFCFLLTVCIDQIGYYLNWFIFALFTWCRQMQRAALCNVVHDGNTMCLVLSWQTRNSARAHWTLRERVSFNARCESALTCWCFQCHCSVFTTTMFRCRACLMAYCSGHISLSTRCKENQIPVCWAFSVDLWASSWWGILWSLPLWCPSQLSLQLCDLTT